MKQGITYAIAVASIALAFAVSAHEVDFTHLHASTNPPTPLKIVPESSGPVKAFSPTNAAVTSGQGFWKFVAMKDLMPTPEETKPFHKGAHGTIVVDSERDIVYWGLEKVGWVAFSNRLTQSWVVKGDPKFASGNLHGADILPQKGFLFSKSQLPLIVAADNVEGEVYLSDTSFQKAQVLGRPGGPYKGKAAFAPTDAVFIDAKNIYVTDGYGSQWFMHATTQPLEYDGTFIGGKEFSRTPHGISKSDHNTLYVSARPEATIKEYVYKKNKWMDSMGLPAGSTVCDVDIWDDYALAPCLDGPKDADGKPTKGPIYIVNLKTKTIASIIRVKEDLGYPLADHIHDAAWYVTGSGRNREVYILFTNWNPGGIGAIKLVSVPDAN